MITEREDLVPFMADEKWEKGKYNWNTDVQHTSYSVLNKLKSGVQ